MQLRTFSVALTAAGIFACSNAEDPETQIRRTIDAMEAAAEARNVGDLVSHLSAHFRDAQGRDAAELARYVRGYFIANQSLHLLTRIHRIEFPTPDESRVHLTVAMVGREAEQSRAWNLAGEIRDFDATFMREGKDWKVTWVAVR